MHELTNMRPGEKAYVVRCHEHGDRLGVAIVAAVDRAQAIARLLRMEPDRAGEKLTAVTLARADPAEVEDARDSEAHWTMSGACPACGAVVGMASMTLRGGRCEDCGPVPRRRRSGATYARRGAG